MDDLQTAIGVLDKIAELIKSQEYDRALSEIDGLRSTNTSKLTSVDSGRLNLYAAISLFYTGDYSGAMKHANIAIDQFRLTEAHALYGDAKSHRGHIYSTLGDYALAADDFREARFAYKRISHTEGELIACNYLARCAFCDGQLAKAREYLTRSIELSEELKDEPRRLSLQANLGQVLTILGDFHDALSLMEFGESALYSMPIAHKCNTHGMLGYLYTLMR